MTNINSPFLQILCWSTSEWAGTSLCVHPYLAECIFFFWCRFQFGIFSTFWLMTDIPSDTCQQKMMDLKKRNSIANSHAICFYFGKGTQFVIARMHTRITMPCFGLWFSVGNIFVSFLSSHGAFQHFPLELYRKRRIQFFLPRMLLSSPNETAFPMLKIVYVTSFCTKKNDFLIIIWLAVSKVPNM